MIYANQHENIRKMTHSDIPEVLRMMHPAVEDKILIPRTASDLEKKITPATKGIVAVHMRGVPCNMDAIMAIAKKHNLIVVEDCAQAAGGTYKGKYLGTIGDCGCFSFQYHKTITAGEGGMILTNDERLYDRCMSYHDTAACWRPDRFAEQRYEGELFCGSNFRMSELTGAVMLAQLGRLDYLLAKMRRNQKHIIDGIRNTPGIRVRPVNDPEGVYCERGG
jgi:dTDP-4-amino-4,6-dideoxygalactose transaminase